MPDNHTHHHIGGSQPLTVAHGVGAFAFATLEEPGVGAAVHWLKRRGSSGPPPVFAMGEGKSRWVHAASIGSKINRKKSEMEQDDDTVG
jgi:hypothetical protein